MSTQMLAIGLQIAVGCVWLLTLALVSAAGRLSSPHDRSLARERSPDFS